MTEHPAEETLAILEGVYTQIQLMSQKGYSPGRVAKRLLTQHPNLGFYYPVLKRRAWGYHLGQKVAGLLADKAIAME